MTVIGGSNRRTCQKRKARSDGWTKAKRALFLDTFAATCNTALSAKTCGMTDHSVRVLKRRDPHFAILYEEALQEGYARIEAELVARALGEQRGDENPTEDDRTPIEPAEFDPQMAIKVMQLRRAEAKARSEDRRGRIFVWATEEETDAALDKKLTAIERRLAKAKAEPET
ncbi:MAG: hypothetical protein ACTHKR_13545 [Sphingomonas sp.]